jgi:Zn-dependent peptidase ImmA (M78 family)
MPRGSVLAMPPHSPSLSSLIKYKRHWGVSVAALNYRLHALHLASDWTYRTLCIHIAQAGYRLTEPEPMLHEKSIILEMVFGYLRDDGTSKAEIARQLSIPAQEIEELTFGLMLNILKGGAGANSATTRSASTRLRLVKG